MCCVCGSTNRDPVPMPPEWTRGELCHLCCDVLGHILMWQHLTKPRTFAKLIEAAREACDTIQPAWLSHV